MEGVLAFPEQGFDLFLATHRSLVLVCFRMMIRCFVCFSIYSLHINKFHIASWFHTKFKFNIHTQPFSNVEELNSRTAVSQAANSEYIEWGLPLLARVLQS